MPRETINIENFHRGIISKVDSGDIPDESCPYCKNINPIYTEGKLQPISDKTTLSTLGPYPPKIGAFIDKSDTLKSLLYGDGFKFRAIDDFHTTHTVTITIANPAVVTYNSHGLLTGRSIIFYTNGSLPTGLNTIAHSFIRIIDTNTFHVYDTYAHAIDTGSTTGRVVTTGTQSGTHGIVLSEDFGNLDVKSITAYNNFANIGLGNIEPKWAGYINRKQFDGIIVKPSADSGPVNHITLTDGGTGYTPGYDVVSIVQAGGSGGTVLVYITAGGVISFIGGGLVGGANYKDGAVTLSDGGAGTNATATITVSRVGTIAGEIIVDNSETVNAGAAVDIYIKTTEPVASPTTVLTTVGDSGGYIEIEYTTGTPFSAVIDGTSKVYLSNFYYETYDADRGTVGGGVLDGEYLITAHTNTTAVTTCLYPSVSQYESITFMSIPSFKLITYRSQFSYKEASGGTYNTPQDIYKDREYTITTTNISKLRIKFTSDGGYIENGEYIISMQAEPNSLLYFQDAALKSYNNDTTVAVGIDIAFYKGTDVDTIFQSIRKYYYGWSFVYDNSQESPIGWREDTAIKGESSNRADIEVTITNPASLNKRITGINIYRADGTIPSKEPESLFRLVQSISVNNGWKYISSTKYGIKIYDSGSSQASYEAATGIPQTLEDISVKYSYATIVNNKLFMAKNYTDYWDDSLRLIFASKPNQFNMIDVSTDLCKVKFVPIGIAGYNGKVIVFGNNEYAIINPEGMYIEYETVGIGAISHQAIYVTDWGVYWCDARGAYYYNGVNTEIISDAISNKVDSGLKCWTDLFNSNTIMNVIYYHKMRSIIFMDVYSGKGFIYCLPNKSWFYWEVGSQNLSTASIFIDKDGVLYLASGTGWYTLCTSTTYLAWEWYSKKFNLGDPGQYKKFYEIKGDGNATITYGIDDAALTSTLTSDVISDTHWKARKLQIKTIGTQSTTLYYLNSIAIIFRRLVGKR